MQISIFKDLNKLKVQLIIITTMELSPIAVKMKNFNNHQYYNKVYDNNFNQTYCVGNFAKISQKFENKTILVVASAGCSEDIWVPVCTKN